MTAAKPAWVAVVLVAAIALTSACESAQEKCAKAREAARSSWDGYVSVLSQQRKGAADTQSQVHAKLSGDVERRLFPKAQELADARYDRSSEAWLRANKTAYNDLCAQDTECSALRQQNLDASAMIEDLDERLPLAILARDTTAREPAVAVRAADAVIVHPEYPQVKASQALARELDERCKDLQPPADVPETKAP